MPSRFNLRVRGPEAGSADGKPTDAVDGAAGFIQPVMIHRAILGSFERTIAILTEHFGGKW